MWSTSSGCPHAHIISSSSIKEVIDLLFLNRNMLKFIYVFSLVARVQQSLTFISHHSCIWPSPTQDFRINSDSFVVDLQSTNGNVFNWVCSSVYVNSCSGCCLNGFFQLVGLSCVLCLVVSGAPGMHIAVNAMMNFKVIA